MNKLIKGAVATAAGVALLMGGAGTFAYWNDSVGITGGTITAGNLAIVDATPTDGVWTVQKDGTGTATAVPNIAAFVASPGDKFTYTKTVKVTATGNNLVATLSLVSGSIQPATPVTSANTNLAGYLTESATFTATGAGVSGGPSTFTITAGSAGVINRDVTVTVTITFPKNAAAAFENNTKLGSVNLTGLSVAINQVYP